MLGAINRLPTAAIRSLAVSLGSGALSHEISRLALSPFAGAQAEEVRAELVRLQSGGFGVEQLSVLLHAVAQAREAQPSPTQLFDLVLSGPDVDGVPTADTGAVLRALFSQAQVEVILVGYTIFNGRRVFAPLAERMECTPTLRTWFCLDIAREFGDGSSDADILRKFEREFRTHHWPWKPVPEVYYDPRALRSDSLRACLHAKCVVVDRHAALLTSANFTEAAQVRNIEAGVLIRHTPTVARLVDYLEGLRASGQLRKCGPFEAPRTGD